MIQIGRARRGASIGILCVAILALGAVGQVRRAQTIIVHVEPPDRSVLPSEVEIRAEEKGLTALSVSDPSTISFNVAFVIDAGPNQSRVLSQEKRL